MMLSLDLIDWYDWRGLHVELSSSAPDNDQRMRASAQRIYMPPYDQSAFNDDQIAMNSLRVLAACHDERNYETSPAGVHPSHEAAVILGLRQFPHAGQRLGDWSLIKSSPEARQYAQSLVAVTNVAWRVSALREDWQSFGSAEDEVWLTCPDLIDLALRHSQNVDPVLRIIDERHELNVTEIERVLSAHALSEGVL